MNRRPKIFTALDFPDAASALEMAGRLRALNPCFKVGLELFVAEGPDFVKRLVASGSEVFLDLKFHDIPNTAAGAVRTAVRTGAAWINVHCAGGSAMLRASAEAGREEAAKLGVPVPKILGVTVLTSLKDEDVQEIGFPRSASAQVKNFVELAGAAGLDGVVCSAHEIGMVKSLAGKSFLTMVPGIRPPGAEAGDQGRVMTPKEAVNAGADCLVIGRPITQAKSPEEALSRVLESL